MMLTVSFEDQTYDIDVPENLIADAQDFYKKMDSDMDKGWQISRKWVDKLNKKKRCQVVADKMLNAFHEEKEQFIILLAGYILKQLPGTKQINIDTSGDISLTEFL